MGPAIDLTNGNPLLKSFRDANPAAWAAMTNQAAPASPPPAAPSPIVDASQRRPIQPIAPATPQAQMAEAPPTLRTSGPIPSPASSGRDTHLESLMPSPTAEQNAIGAPRYDDPMTSGFHRQKLSDMSEQGSGLDQLASKHPFIGRPLQVLDAIGRGLFPGIEMGIPGTEGHHQVLMGQERGRIKDIETGQDEAAKRAQEEAQTRLAGAQTENQEAMPELHKTQAELAAAKQSETMEHHKAQIDSQLRAHGFKLDEDGNVAPLTEEESSAGQNAGNDLKGAQQELAAAKTALAQAQTSNIPEARELAQQRIAVAEKRLTLAASKPAADHGQNLVDPTTHQMVRVKPGDVVPQGAQTLQGMNAENTAPPQIRVAGGRAETVIKEVPRILKNIDSMSTELGPVMGRWNEFMQGNIGMDNPKMAGLRGDLMMLATTVALAHAVGRLPENLRAEFDHAINAPKQTPENLHAVINAVLPWMQDMAEQAHPNGGNARSITPSGGNQPAASGKEEQWTRDPSGRLVKK